MVEGGIMSPTKSVNDLKFRALLQSAVEAVGLEQTQCTLDLLSFEESPDQQLLMFEYWYNQCAVELVLQQLQ